MSKTEIELITSYLKQTDKFFEWGCGGSTIYFSKYVELYRSVEHNQKWFMKIDKIKSPNTELYLYENNDNYKTYINSIENFDTIYDSILIDGRCRVRCSQIAKKFLKPNGILFVHDYFLRPYYHTIAESYTLIDKITNTPQTLAVFKNEIHNRY